ncbi:TraX family protein [Paenibacillus elgii]
MIKLIAFIAMLTDHYGVIYHESSVEIFRMIGRLSFPLFAWGIANGAVHTKNLNMYLIRLLTVALVSQIPYHYLFKNSYVNVCFTLFFGLLAVAVYKSKKHIIFKLLILILIMFTADLFNFEYGIYGICSILIFFIFKDRLISAFLLQLLIIFSFQYIYFYHPIQYIAPFSILFILLFRKYDFKLNRTFQYLFYPAHLTLFLCL